MKSQEPNLNENLTPEEAVKLMADFISKINHKCELLTNSLERIASGMLTQGESKEIAETALDDTTEINWS